MASPEKRLEALTKQVSGGAFTAASLLGRGGVLPFGVFALDYGLLPTGGVPIGRTVELAGEEGSWKSTTAIRMAASALRNDERPIGICDTEGSFYDVSAALWARRSGLDLERATIFPHEHSNEILTQAYIWIVQGTHSVVIIDSIAMCSPEEMLDATEGSTKNLRDWGKKTAVAADARAITEWTKAIVVPAMRNRVTVLVVNQWRDTIKEGRGFGSGAAVRHTPGGRALKYSYSLRLEMESEGPIYEKTTGDKDGKVIGASASVKNIKCKFAPSGTRTGVNTPGPLRMYIRPGDQLEQVDDVVYGAVQCGAIHKGGAWFTWEAGKIKAQGYDAFLKALLDAGKFDALLEQTKATIVGNYHDLAASNPEAVFESDDDDSTPAETAPVEDDEE